MAHQYDPICLFLPYGPFLRSRLTLVLQTAKWCNQEVGSSTAVRHYNPASLRPFCQR